MQKSIVIFFSILLLGKLSAQTALPNTISTSEKIYGLSKFWNQTNTNFVYFDQIDKEQWEQDYKSMIREVQDTKNDYEYYRLLQKFGAKLKDGHTNVWFPKAVNKLILNGEFGTYKLYIKNIDGRAIITRINASKKKEIPVGTEILEVNGIPTKAYIEQFVKPYISSSTNHFLQNQSTSELLTAPIGTTYTLQLKKPNGKLFTRKFKIKKTEEKEVHPPFEDRELLDFQWMDNKIAYIGLNSFGNPKIDSLFIARLPEINKAKKLIIDLRNNGGGNTNIGIQILKYLTPDDQLQSFKSYSRLHIPTYKAWGQAYNLKAKDTAQGSAENRKILSQVYLNTHDSYYHEFPYYNFENEVAQSERVVIPTAVLIGNYTASAAEDFLISADNQKHMTKIGQPTYGSTGQPISFDLPGGGSGRVCTKKDIYPDGRAFVGYGVQPDILIKKTYQDYINNTDPVLKKAIEYLNRT